MEDAFHTSVGGSSEGSDLAFTIEVCRALVEHARDIILLVRPNGDIVLANSAAESAYGYSRVELRGMNVTQLREPSSRSAVVPQIEKALESGILFETEHLHRDQDAFPVEVSSRGVRVGGEQFVLSVVRDITQRKEHDDQMSAVLSELQLANRQLEGLLRIVSGVVGLTDLDSLMSETLHELRDVMNADGAVFLVLERDRWVLLAQDGYSQEEMEGFSIPAGKGFASMVADAGDALWLSDITGTPAHIDVDDRLGIRAILGVPLYLEGGLYGVLECTWSSQRMASEAERVLLQVAADRIMAAIASVRRLEGTRRSRDIEAALAAAGAALTSSHRLEETIPEALGVMASALECDGAAFGSYRDGAFRVEYGLGVDPGSIDVPNHRNRVVTSVVTPPVVLMGGGVISPAPLRDALGWEEAVVAPVRVRGEWVGALLFGRSQDSGGFDRHAEEAVRRLSLVLSLAYANARDFETEHHIAEVLQEALLNLGPSVKGVEFGHRYRSGTLATRVGGDLYDVFEMSDGLVGILIGDVSGKGLDAAVFTTLVKQTLRAFAHESASPSDIISRTNSVLADPTRMREYATLLLVVLDPMTGRARYCRAGHPPALIVHSDGSVEVTACGSTIVGAFDDANFDEGEFVLGADDLLVLHTDGVTDSRNGEGRFFGDERLLTTASSLAGTDPDSAVEVIERAVSHFSGGRFFDDVAVVAVKLA